MEAATQWGLLFHQDPVTFAAGTEWDMAQRLASITVAERILKRAAGDE